MYLNTVVLASLLGLAAAASSDSSSDVTSLVAQLPTCSVSCLDQGATSAGCGTSDYSCQCEKQEAITANATSCLASSCALSNITTTQSVVSKICDAVDGNSTSTDDNATSTSTSSSSSSSSSSTAGSSAANRPELYSGLAWAAVAGVVGLMAL